MTNFFEKIRDVGPTVDHLLEGKKQECSEFFSYENLSRDDNVAEGIKRLKRCFDLADQLYEQTLVQREVLLDACGRLKQWGEEVYKNFEMTLEMTDNCKLNSYYQLARGNVRFRQALILNRWKPLPYQMCQEAQTCFKEAKEANDSVCCWLAQLMAAKCEREMEQYRYHHISGQPFQEGNGAFGAFQAIAEGITPNNTELANIALDAVINMGRCLRNQMKHQEAIPYFVAVCAELAPRCGDGEGESIIAQKKLEEKYGEINAGVKGKLHMAVGKLQLEQQRDAKKDPQYLQALVNLVSCLTDGPRAYAEAQKLALHVLKNIDSYNIDMQNNMGRLYRKIKSFSKAEESYQKVMENLGNARRTGASYIVDETDPLNRYAELERAKCFVRQQNYKKALEQLEWLLNFYQDDIELLLWKGLCYQNQGCLAQAVGTLQQLVRTETSIRRGTVGLKARYVMGNCYLAWKDPAQAKIWFYEIWKSEPNDLLALKKYVWCQKIIGEYGEGKSNREIMDNLNQQSAEQRRNGLWGEIYNCMGRRYLHMNQDKIVTALNCFQQVLQEESGNIEALCGAACCLRRLKQNVKNIDVDFVKKLIGEKGTEAKGFKGMAVALAKKAREVAPGNPHVESEYVLCLLSDVKQSKDEKDELVEQVLNSERVFPQELCVEALAKLAEHVGNKKLSYAPFCALRPMKWEAAAEQVSALVDSPEFQTLEAEQQGKLLAHVYRLHHTMEQIKTTLRLNREQLGEKPCWHYTRMGTMQKLLLNQGEQRPRFRLTNVAYMNDSAEGEPFGTLLKQCGSAPEMLQAYGLLPGGEVPNASSLRNVYLTSLCTEDDYIYMWAIYADKGTGCSLKFDENFFDVKDSYPQGYIPFHEEKNSYPLYRIVYLTGKGEFQSAEGKLEGYLRTLKVLLRKIQREMQGVSLSYITAMLDQVRYLFKYDEYSSEDEVRCLVVTRNRKLAAGEGDTPYLYTEIDKEIRLDEVRFGPKVSKSPEKEAWMYATDRVKKVSYSNRHYR